jgi:aminoglycoside N3'-acetyltransferase
MIKEFELFQIIGMQPFHAVEGHFSFKAIKKIIKDAIPERFCISLYEFLKDGGILIPTFTYNFKKIVLESEKFDKLKTPSKVGVISDTFWRLTFAKRTSSPTHSFAFAGKAFSDLDEKLNPNSPLGLESPLNYLFNLENSHIFLVGVNFTSLSFIHFLEVYYKVPYCDIFPWVNYGIYNIGISVEGEIELKETPGCSKSFFTLEEYAIKKGIINSIEIEGIKVYYFNVKEFAIKCDDFFNKCYENLLCDDQLCSPCMYRRKKLKLM